MSERRVVEPSLFSALALLFIVVELWAIADRLMDIRDVLRGASAIEARRAATGNTDAVHESATRKGDAHD